MARLWRRAFRSHGSDTASPDQREANDTQANPPEVDLRAEVVTIVENAMSEMVTKVCAVFLDQQNAHVKGGVVSEQPGSSVVRQQLI
jgi:hypothetical protein